MNEATTPAKEGVLEINFHAPWRKADDIVPQGLMAVDYIIEKAEALFLLEIKDYDHPKAPSENKKRDYKMLTDPNAMFPLEIGMKVKDTLLKLYADGISFDKPVKFLLLIRLAKLEPNDRERLLTWIMKYIPTGLKQSSNFTSIGFDMPTFAEFYDTYGFSIN
jgi:hypothetical protein